MEQIKEDKIREKVRNAIKDFSENFEVRYMREITDPTGVINSKKNNAFVSELGNEFMFYSAFCRSFDSSFGKVLEKLSNDIADISYEVVLENISSYLLPEQIQRKSNIMNEYDKHIKPKIEDYTSLHAYKPANVDSYKKQHVTDNHFYNPETKEHFIIELKAGGDLDIKKAKSEKEALIDEYYILLNALEDPEETVKIYLATAYNMYGEGNEWKQERVKQFFSDDELLIGKDYWNFVCDDKDGYDIIIDEYKKSSKYILEALDRIKNAYFN
ncbi:MAG: TdeIII family type II restriction endonuclease [Bacilli bacterium]